LTINDYSEHTSRMGRPRSALIGLIGVLLIGCGFSAPSAWAGYTVTLQQVGANVVATGSGPIDLTGLSFSGTVSSFSTQIFPNIGFIQTGLSGFSVDKYLGFSGPGSFGSGPDTVANSGSGDLVGISLALGLYVPQSYVSGTPLSDSATYDNATFSSLGVTPGTYEWTWGTGQNQNLTLIAVPEPRVGPLLGAGLLLLVGIRLRQLRPDSGAA
jgi:hypothetical protein